MENNLPRLQYVKLSGYKYEVHELVKIPMPEFDGEEIDEKHFSLHGGVMSIFAGYAWDGPSGPTLDTKDTIRASLAHDALYQCIREGHLGRERRAAADWVLYRIGRECGMPAWRALIWFVGLRLFGGSAAERRAVEPQDKVYQA